MKPLPVGLALVLLTAAVAATVTATSFQSGTPVPRDAKLSVELALTPAAGADGTAQVAATLTLRNSGTGSILVQRPDNRQAVVFVVMDAHGNIVAPEMRGKSDPAFAEVELRPGAELKHDFERLEFVTGTAYMGYDLKAGRTYRVVAVYRPSGIAGPGFCSAEQVVTVKGRAD